MITDAETWSALVEDWQEKHNAVVSFPLFVNGLMQNSRLAEFEELLEAEREARQRMEAFIAKLR